MIDFLKPATGFMRQNVSDVVDESRNNPTSVGLVLLSLAVFATYTPSADPKVNLGQYLFEASVCMMLCVEIFKVAKEIRKK
jgi:hypothetical protein